MNKMKKLINQLHQSAEKLNDENKEIFRNIIVYIRFSNIKIADSEEFLQQLLDSILIAQEQGKTIESVIGTDDIRTYCQQIVNTYKESYSFFSRSGDTIMFSGMVITILSIIYFIIQNISQLIIGSSISNLSLNINVTLSVIVQFIFSVLMLLFIMFYMKNTSFKKITKKSLVIEFLVLWLFMSIFFGFIYLSDKLFGGIFLIEVPIFLLIPISLFIYLLGQYFSEK